MQNIIDRILDKLKIDDYIDVEPQTMFCNAYDPIGLRGHIADVVKEVLLEEK